jgi:indole-3-glycerol phosphate synthase
MANILEQIIQDKKDTLSLIKKNNSLDSLEKKIKSLDFFINFKKAIQNNKGISLISEIKRASPSAGVLVKNFNHLNIAKMYIDNGTTCLSVLSEEKHFLGKLDHITDIKNKFKIPVLAKDFFIDPYQVALSKSFGSDCILIIIAALDGKQADEIYFEALKHNLSVIVEVHDANEAEAALKYDKALIGINNRNLKTLDVSINNTISIFEVVKSHKSPVISESGIKNENDAKHVYDKTGIKNFLIGESLLNSDNPEELMKRLKQISQ